MTDVNELKAKCLELAARDISLSPPEILCIANKYFDFISLENKPEDSIAKRIFYFIGKKLYVLYITANGRQVQHRIRYMPDTKRQITFFEWMTSWFKKSD